MLPISAKNALPASVLSRGSRTLVPSRPSIVPAPQMGARYVGRSSATSASQLPVAEAIRSIPKTSPLMSRKVTTAAGVVAVSTLAGMGIEELLDILPTIDPSEIAQLVGAADESGDADLASQLAEAYNVSIVARASLQPSTADGNTIALDNIQRPGLGISPEQVDYQQTVLRNYKSLRAKLSYEDIYALRLLMTTATDDDIMALEDLYRG